MTDPSTTTTADAPIHPPVRVEELTVWVATRSAAITTTCASTPAGHGHATDPDEGDDDEQ